MTEDEAKTKWCPETPRLLASETLLEFSLCIGSACMAWRVQKAEWNVTLDRWYKVEQSLAQNAKTYEFEMREVPKWGYCGKAGKP